MLYYYICRRCSPLFFLLLALLLWLPGCQNFGSAPPSEQDALPAEDRENDLGHEYVNEDFSISFYYPGPWKIISETEHNETLTLRIQGRENGAASLIVTVIPEKMFRDELISEAEQLLLKALYHVNTEMEVEEKTISGKQFTVLTVTAGERERVGARTAIYPGDEHSYLFTLVAREENFSQKQNVLEDIIGSFKSDLSR